jgi:ABC-2 type transport system permease protein
VLPLTYAYDALQGVADQSGVVRGELLDLGITVALTIAVLLAGAATLRRRTP